MYANLEVKLRLKGEDEPQTISAYDVDLSIDDDGRGLLIIREDLNDGGMTCAVAGEDQLFDLEMVEWLAVGADF